MEDANGELLAAVCAVMTKVREVTKTGFNEKHRYFFASDADILAAVQPAMAEHGLALIPRLVESKTVEMGLSKSGSTMFRTDVLVSYSLHHRAGGSLVVMSCGSGSDMADKGVYKALTGVLKYALCSIFLIPRVDDAEAHDAPDSRPRPAGAPRGPLAGPKPEIIVTKSGKRFLKNWSEFMAGGVLSLIPLGQRCGELISNLSTSDILTLNTQAVGALENELPEDTRLALVALQNALGNALREEENK